MKALILVAAFVTFSASLFAAEKTPSAKIGQFKLGANITGPPTTLADAAGKAVLIDAWGINCGPCLESLPEIEKISKRYKDRMVVFGAHSQAGTDEEVKAVVKKNKLSYSITKGVTGPVPFDRIPHIFIFDPKGELVFSGSPFDKEFERSLRKAVGGATSSPAVKPSGLDYLKKPAA